MNLALTVLRRMARIVAVIVLVAIGSTTLVRFAPGYLSDAREMDSRYGGAAREQLAVESSRSSSVFGMLRSEVSGWLHRDLGISRQYEVPVLELIQPRLAATAGLLLRSILLAWMIAGCAAALSNSARRCAALCHLTSTVFLAVPIGAMGTLCLLADRGGPLLVMTTLLAARDFKFVDRMVRKAWSASHLLQARAQGIHPVQLLWVHLLPGIMPQLGALATLSVLTALGAVVPVEVIFSMPGIGQLAWNAAMNRDLPVLLAVTMLMSIAVTGGGLGTRVTPSLEWERA